MKAHHGEHGDGPEAFDIEPEGGSRPCNRIVPRI
jgi:hypothetical protein